MDISLSNESSSSSPTHRHHTTSTPPTRQYALASSGTSERSRPSHPSESPAKKKKPCPEEEVALIINPKPRNSVAIVTKNQAISKDTADAAYRSLNREIGRKKEEGALEAGISSSVRLEWTLQTQEAVRVFETALKANPADLAPIQSLGGNPNGTLKIACPIVYSEVLLPEPLRYPSSALGRGIIGILALGTLVLPEIADSGPNTIESGSVAYFRDSSPVVYRASKGRGIMFYIAYE